MINYDLTFASLSHSQQQSPFFMLSGELRNKIYQEVFDDSAAFSGRVNLTQSNIVALGLVLACQQLLTECKTMRTDAAQIYWLQRFYMDVPRYITAPEAFAKIPDSILERITHLALVPSSGGFSAEVITHSDGLFCSTILLARPRARWTSMRPALLPSGRRARDVYISAYRQVQNRQF